MTNKERLIENNKKIDNLTQVLKNKVIEASKETLDSFKGLLDGSLEEFDNTKLGLTTLSAYRFYNFSNLKKINLKGIKNIGASMCRSCNKLEELVLDDNLEKIGEYAFYQAATGLSSDHLGLILNFKTLCTIDSNAFYRARLKEVHGKLANTGTYVFDGSSKTYLKVIDVELQGSIGASLFANNNGVEYINIDPKSDITSLGTGVFYALGCKRENPELNPLIIDLRNSSFTSTGNYAFGSTPSSTLCKYNIIKLPKTVNSIGSYTFSYNDHLSVYFTNPVPAALNSAAFNNNTNLNIYVPFNSIGEYKNADNWSVQAAYIKGYLEGTNLEIGQQLPKYDASGYKLTWYSDVDLTNEISEVTDTNITYYCLSGDTTIEVIPYSQFYKNANLTVTDGTTIYKDGYNIPVGTQLTINAEGIEENTSPYLFTANGVTISSGSVYTTLAETPLSIVAIFSTGESLGDIDLTLANNSWPVISKVCKLGAAKYYWKVGDTKPYLNDGVIYTAKLVDLTKNRYTYTNTGEGTSCVFETVEVTPERYVMDSDGTTNIGGWTEYELKETLNTIILDNLESELRDVLVSIQIPGANGGGANYSAVTYSANKLFLATLRELGDINSITRPEEGFVWDYYSAKTQSLRVKYIVNTTTAQAYWVRSPYASSDTAVAIMNYNGIDNGHAATSKTAISICWAW